MKIKIKHFLMLLRIKVDYAMVNDNDGKVQSSHMTAPRCEKTGLRGFRPGPTQTGLYCHRRWLEA